VRTRTWALLAGILLGTGVGRLVSGRQRRRRERDLYHPRATERQAALTWLARHPSGAALAQLRAWLPWEPIPALQRRGTLILSRMAHAMGQDDAA
jgi:hypothetical protein